MRTLAVLMVFGLIAALPLAASAQDGGKRKHGKKREAMLKKFDKDEDGKLSKDERRAAREARGDEGKGGKLRKRILRRFDKDGDRELNEQERGDLKKLLESHRKHRKGDRRRR